MVSHEHLCNLLTNYILEEKLQYERPILNPWLFHVLSNFVLRNTAASIILVAAACWAIIKTELFIVLLNFKFPLATRQPTDFSPDL